MKSVKAQAKVKKDKYFHSVIINLGSVTTMTLGLQGPQNEGNRPLRGCYKLGKASLITLGNNGGSFEYMGRPGRFY